MSGYNSDDSFLYYTDDVPFDEIPPEPGRYVSRDKRKLTIKVDRTIVQDKYSRYEEEEVHKIKERTVRVKNKTGRTVLMDEGRGLMISKRQCIESDICHKTKKTPTLIESYYDDAEETIDQRTNRDLRLEINSIKNEKEKFRNEIFDAIKLDQSSKDILQQYSKKKKGGEIVDTPSFQEMIKNELLNNQINKILCRDTIQAKVYDILKDVTSTSNPQTSSNSQRSDYRDQMHSQGPHRSQYPQTSYQQLEHLKVPESHHKRILSGQLEAPGSPLPVPHRVLHLTPPQLIPYNAPPYYQSHPYPPQSEIQSDHLPVPYDHANYPSSYSSHSRQTPSATISGDGRPPQVSEGTPSTNVESYKSYKGIPFSQIQEEQHPFHPSNPAGKARALVHQPFTSTQSTDNAMTSEQSQFGFFCHKCKLGYNTTERWRTHIQGDLHKIMTGIWFALKPFKWPSTHGTKIYCICCEMKMVFTTELSYKQHMRGKNHKGNEAKWVKMGRQLPIHPFVRWSDLSDLQQGRIFK